MARNVSEDLFAFALTASFTICGTSFFFYGKPKFENWNDIHAQICMCVWWKQWKMQTLRFAHRIYFISLSSPYLIHRFKQLQFRWMSLSRELNFHLQSFSLTFLHIVKLKRKVETCTNLGSVCQQQVFDERSFSEWLDSKHFCHDNIEIS